MKQGILSVNTAYFPGGSKHIDTYMGHVSPNVQNVNSNLKAFTILSHVISNQLKEQFFGFFVNKPLAYLLGVSETQNIHLNMTYIQGSR